MTCNACNTTIYDRLMSKTSPDNKIWHSNCLKCCECNQLLDSKYFETKGRLYCRNDYLAYFRPSCSGCGNKINDEQYFFSITSRSTSSVIRNNNNNHMNDLKHQSVINETNHNNLLDNTNPNNNIDEKDKLNNIVTNNVNGNDDSTGDNNINAKTGTLINQQLQQTNTTNLFFHDKCFICNYCARPLQKGDKYCILENTPTSPNQSLLICHDICAMKIHSAQPNQLNDEVPIRQTNTKSGAPRARRGRTKQQPPASTQPPL